MDTSVIYSGDNAEVLRTHILDNSIDLIYADPPFFSNQQYEVIWGDGYELRAFEDRWKGGIENYIAWMEPKLRECHRVLKNTGSMYLHCDWHANAHLRILMDKIFGEKMFRNAIVWHYSGWNKKNKYNFNSRHDTIMLYAKTNEQKFYSWARPWASKEEYVKIRKQKIRVDPKTRKEYVLSDAGGGKRVKRFLEDAMKQGAYVDDVWDIDKLNNSAKEALGYPTQKPEALLERIILASSDTMDIVLDPFCGCGTSIAVAHKQGRRWIGVDVSPTACKLIAKRMRKIGAKNIQLIGLPRTIEELKKVAPFEFQNWVFEKLHGRVNPKKVGDMGIDGWVELDVPTQVKQSEGIGRNVVDNFETAIRRMKKNNGVIVAFSFGSGAYEEVARCKNQEFMEIKLKTVEEILKEP
ncbi:MAG: DNA methyltransferase [Candidatus Bathyarchaeia archaeon]|jgi:DNA modification methylase